MSNMTLCHIILTELVHFTCSTGQKMLVFTAAFARKERYVWEDEEREICERL